LAPLTENANPALINLLTALPHIYGAIAFYFAASYSKKHRIRLKPTLLGLPIMVTGLIIVVHRVADHGTIGLNVLVTFKWFDRLPRDQRGYLRVNELEESSSVKSRPTLRETQCDEKLVRSWAFTSAALMQIL
jgi:hypothetical protein